MVRVLIVNPADLNLADVKALAAEWGWDVAPSNAVPRGQAFLSEYEDPLDPPPVFS